MKKNNNFDELASIKSDPKPFRLIKSGKGKRIWESENGLGIEAVKIGSNKYCKVYILKGLPIGDINCSGKLKIKCVQDALSELGSKYNFHFIKRQVKQIRESNVGKSLYRDWSELRTNLITCHSL